MNPLSHMLHSPFVLLPSLLLAPLSRATDASILKPPPGAPVAVVMFEDLQCPDSASAYPLVQQAVSESHVPLVLRAFPLPMHDWSFDAAVWTAFFDSRSQELGSRFRGYIYANQNQITPANLRQFVQKFGDANQVSIPSGNDPGGKLADHVKADFLLGQEIGLEHAPTIFVVGRTTISAPFVVLVKKQALDQAIAAMLKQAATETPARQAAKRRPQ